MPKLIKKKKNHVAAVVDKYTSMISQGCQTVELHQSLFLL